jgi:hypothetical protein
MRPVWKWLIGILAALLLLSVLAMPLIMTLFYSSGGYGMMSRGSSAWRMPMHYGYGGGWSSMMGGGYGWMGTGMILSRLIQLGLLVLIVLGIIWLVRALGRQTQKGD